MVRGVKEKFVKQRGVKRGLGVFQAGPAFRHTDQLCNTIFVR